MQKYIGCLVLVIFFYGASYTGDECEYSTSNMYVLKNDSHITQKVDGNTESYTLFYKALGSELIAKKEGDTYRAYQKTACGRLIENKTTPEGTFDYLRRKFKQCALLSR